MHDKLVIGPPQLMSECPRLAELYHNQLAVLDEIVDMDNEYATTLGSDTEVSIVSYYDSVICVLTIITFIAFFATRMGS